MKARGILSHVMVTVCLALSFVVIPPLAGPVFSAEQVTLSFNVEIAAGSNMTGVWPFRNGGRFQYLVDEYTGGRVKLRYREGLYDVTNSILAVGDGRVDLGTQITAFCSATYPLLHYGAVPGLLSDFPDQGYEWSNSLLDPEMQKILDAYSRKKGFIVIGGCATTPGNANFSKKALRKIEDWKGLKVRAGGFLKVEEINALGASAVNISSAEVTDALIKGAVDAVNTTINFGCEHGYTDITKYCAIWPSTQNFPYVIIANAKKFDSLPKDLQEGLMKAGHQLTKELGTTTEMMALSYQAWVRTSKCELIFPEAGEVQKMANLMEPVIKAWLNVAGPEGPQVLRIAAKYSRGYGRDKVLQMAK